MSSTAKQIGLANINDNDTGQGLILVIIVTSTFLLMLFVICGVIVYYYMNSKIGNREMNTLKRDYRRQINTKQKAAQKLLEEGNQRLENSLKKGDFSDIQAAYALSKSGTEKIKSIDEEMTKIMGNVSIIQQKRVRAEHEQLKKKNKLVDEQSKNENDQMF